MSAIVFKQLTLATRVLLVFTSKIMIYYRNKLNNTFKISKENLKLI